MTDALKPRDAQDAEEAVRAALAEGASLEVVGHGSKREIGRPVQSARTLDLSGLRGVTLYEPEELVLTARAGTPLDEIETLLGSRGQHLGFEPMDATSLFGEQAARATIGGTLAAALSGPRRISAGGGRDHFLGFSAVSGRGQRFKSGGRVVKNVTGYDLCKLMAGSWGTLAVLTEVTLKVLPRPETETSILLHGLDDDAAIRAMTMAMGLPCEVTGAAHLPAAVTARIPLIEAIAGGRALTALRIEGIGASIVWRKGVLRTGLKEFGETGSSAELVSRNLWRAIRDATPFAASRSAPDQPLWRVSTAPAKGAEFARQLGAESGAQVFYDWAGGLVWALVDYSADAGAAIVRRALKGVGGHATLVRASAAVRAATAVFQPPERALGILTKRIKDSFDPQAVLNPGRMHVGM